MPGAGHQPAAPPAGAAAGAATDAADGPARPDGTRNQSVTRAIAILDLVAAERRPMGVREIARALGVSATIVQRLINTLTHATYLERAGDGSRYVVGYRAFQMGNAFFAQNNLLAVAMPMLSALADREVNGFLGVLRGNQVVYLAAVESNGPISIKHRPGDVTTIHTTALGKALLAELGNGQVRKMLGDRLERLTPHSIATLDALCADLDRVRARGYAINDQENRVGVYSAGTVIRDASGRAVAALSGAVPTTLAAEYGKDEVVRQIVEAAHRVSRSLGAAADLPLPAIAAPDAGPAPGPGRCNRPDRG